MLISQLIKLLLKHSVNNITSTSLQTCWLSGMLLILYCVLISDVLLGISACIVFGVQNIPFCFMNLVGISRLTWTTCKIVFVPNTITSPDSI